MYTAMWEEKANLFNHLENKKANEINALGERQAGDSSSYHPLDPFRGRILFREDEAGK